MESCRAGRVRSDRVCMCGTAGCEFRDWFSGYREL